MRITNEDIARGGVLAGISSEGPWYDPIEPCRFCGNQPSAFWHVSSEIIIFVCHKCAENVLLPLAADAANLGHISVGACEIRLTRACADRLYRSTPREALDATKGSE
jgi:hypothetical protein